MLSRTTLFDPETGTIDVAVVLSGAIPVARLVDRVSQPSARGSRSLSSSSGTVGCRRRKSEKASRRGYSSALACCSSSHVRYSSSETTSIVKYIWECETPQYSEQ